MEDTLQLIGSGIYATNYNITNNAVQINPTLSLPVLLPFAGRTTPWPIMQAPLLAYELPSIYAFQNVHIKIRVKGHSTGEGIKTIGATCKTTCNSIENILGQRLNLDETDPEELEGVWTNVGQTGNGRLPQTAGNFEVDIECGVNEQRYVHIGPANTLIVLLYKAYSYDDSAQIYIDEIVSATIESDDNYWFKVIPNYPVSVNIKKDTANIFTWQKQIELPDVIEQAQYTPIVAKHSIEYRITDQSSEVITQIDTNEFQTIPANTFSVGHHEYRIIWYTYGDYYVVSEWAEFNAIGVDEAPTILSVSNESIPTVAWQDSNQDAFIVRVKDLNQKIIYDSGIIASLEKSYKIPKMFENGTYIVEVKELNTFGYFSEWGSLEFTLEPEEVDPPTNIFAFVNNQYGVEIQGIPAEDAAKTFVVRKEKDSNEVEIIGEYTGTPFIDYSTKGGVFYEYTLRNYNEGYKDGEWVPLQTKIKEIIIQDGRDLSKFIELYMTGNSNFAPDWTEEVDRTLYNCLGRKYPVKEPGEWINAGRSFTAYIKEEKWPQLYDMAINAPKVYYKAKGEYFACDMQIEDAGRYIGGGRMVKFNLTRIDDKGISIL